MSKILYPSLRLGYIVAPHQLVEPMIKIRAVMDQHSPAIDRDPGPILNRRVFPHSHQKDAKIIFGPQRLFYPTIQQVVRQILHPRNPGSWITLRCLGRQKEHMPVITRVSTDIGIRPSPLSSCFMKVEPKPALTFGFAAWSRAQIREGLSKFAAALNSKLN